MTFAVGSSLVNYKVAEQSRDRLLAQFAKTPDYARNVQYFKDNIGKVKSPDDLLKDRRLLTVALSAFQLESEVDSKGIIKKLLADDSNDPKSLARRMADPRFQQFAQAFASLKSDGGKQLGDPSNVAKLLDKYQINEFEKSLGEDDPAVRQALYFKRTVEDTIDLKNVHELMTSFQKSSGVAGTLQYYRDNIANVTSVGDLLKNDKLLSVALSAYHVDSLLTDKPTVQRLLTEDPTKAGSLAQTDSRYLAFAKGFASLRYDGGAQLQSAAGIDSVLSAYQTNEFEKSLGLDDGTAKTAFTAQMQASDPTVDAAGYYRANVKNVKGVDDLLDDSRLLNVALSAFDLGSLAGDKDTVRQLLTENPAASGSLARTDARYMQFATEFASLKSDGGAQISGASDIDNVVGAFQAKLYGDAPNVAQSIDYYRTNIFKVKTVDDLANDGMLLNVALSAHDLGSLLNDKTTVQKLLTEDPTQPTSLAQTSGDARYLAFATEFASLKSDGGAQIRSSASVGAVTSEFQANLFSNAPTAAQQAAYYKANIGKVTSSDDLVNDGMLLNVALSSNGLGSLLNDTSTVQRLLNEIPELPNSLARTDPRYMAFAQQYSTMWLDNGAAVRSAKEVDATVSSFQNKLLRNSATAGDLSQYYRDNIGRVASPADLMGDDQLLTVALNSYGLGSLMDDKSKVQRLLSEDPTAPGALAWTDPAYAKFAKAFDSLKTDGGAKIHGAADVDAVTSAYQTEESDRLYALAHPTGRTGLYGTSGEKTIASLLSDLTGSKSYAQAVDYYRANIGRVSSVDGLLGDSKLLGVALSAFKMDELSDSPSTLRTLLTQDPNDPNALARTDPRFMGFAQAFVSLKDNRPIPDSRSTDAVLASYQTNEFQKSLESKAKQSLSSDGTVTVYQILADKTLSAVVRGALSLPDQVAALNVDQQVAAMKRAGLDVTKLQDAASLDKMIQRFLVNAGQQASGSTDPVLSLFGGGDSSGGSGSLISLLV